jgi:hypothetical protein
MANKKISELDPVTSLEDTDLVPVVTDLDTTPKSNKITWTSLKSLLAALFQTLANKVTSFQETPDNTHYPSEKLVKDSLDAKAPIASPTFTGTVGLPKTVNVKDTSADHEYKLAVSELTADRTITLPLLTGNDEFVFKAHTQTLTNKRITPRVSTEESSATPTINTDNVDAHSITALATNITSMTTNLSGTPTNFQRLLIRIKDNGTARAITWGASFEAKGVALPTTTVISKVLTVGFIYDTVTSKWGCVASAQEE